MNTDGRVGRWLTGWRRTEKQGSRWRWGLKGRGDCSQNLPRDTEQGFSDGIRLPTSVKFIS